MKRVLVLGTNRFCEELAEVVAQAPGLEIAGYIANLEADRDREELEGLPVYWIDELPQFSETHWAICGLSRRAHLIERAAACGMRFATAVHPSAQVSPSCHIGEGNIIGAGAVIAAHATLGRHVMVNRGVLIGHHVSVGDFVTLSPGANVASSCRIGRASYLGMGTVVTNERVVGPGSMLCAGAVLTKDLPERVKAAGAPARVIQRDFDIE